MPLAQGRDMMAALASRSFAYAAFNVSNMETAEAIIGAADSHGAPVFIQVSPGAIAYAGYDTLTRIVFGLAEAAVVPVVVHLDHCREVDMVFRAIEDGFGSVMFDGSQLPMHENIRQTQRVVARARPAGVSVEGELGVIGGREDTTPAQAILTMTEPDEARMFVAATDVDIFAPALGTIHRMPSDAVTLDIGALERIATAAGRPIALHGGSGLIRSQIAAAITAGVGKVNVSSNVSRALASGIRATWQLRPDELDLRRFLGEGRQAVAAMASEYLELTNSSGRYAAPLAQPCHEDDRAQE